MFIRCPLAREYGVRTSPEELQSEATQLVPKLRPYIDVLAKELLRRTTMSQSETERLLVGMPTSDGSLGA